MNKFLVGISVFTLLILISTVANAQWKEVLHTSGQDEAIVVSNTNIFTGFDRNYGVYVSKNQGTNWTPIDSGLTNPFVGHLAVNGSNLFAGTSTGMFMSTDNGSYWTAINAGLPKTSISALLINGTYLFAGTSGQGAFRLNTTNINAGWTPIDNGLTTPNVPTYYLDSTIDAFAVSGANLFAASNNGVFLSTNNGTNWDSVNTGLQGSWPTEATCFAVDGTNLFVGNNGSGVFLSTNNGTSWDSVNTGLTDRYVSSLLSVNGTYLLAGTNGNGVYLSTNNGSSWTSIDSGLTNLKVFCLAYDGTYLYAGTGGSSTQGGGVWRRPFSDITGIREATTNQLPRNYSLQQNYPNPFNPSTIISYQISAVSHVELGVYNALGEKVAELVNKEQSAGTYKLTFNASSLASGIYFYKLQAGNYISVKKMILLK